MSLVTSKVKSPLERATGIQFPSGAQDAIFFNFSAIFSVTILLLIMISTITLALSHRLKYNFPKSTKRWLKQ